MSSHPHVEVRYLPVDVRLASGEDGALAHNAWPVLGARVNEVAAPLGQPPVFHRLDGRYGALFAGLAGY